MILTDIIKKAGTAIRGTASIALAYAFLNAAPMPNKISGCAPQETEAQPSQQEAGKNSAVYILVDYQTEYVFSKINGKLSLVKEISRDAGKAYQMHTGKVYVVRATKNTRVDYWRKNEIWTYINENGKHMAMSAEQIEAASIAIMKTLNGAKFNEKKINPGDLVCFYDADGNSIIHVDEYFLNESAIQATSMIRGIKSKGENNINPEDHEKIINNLINRYGRIYFTDGEKEILIREQEAINLAPEHAWIRISELRQRELNKR